MNISQHEEYLRQLGIEQSEIKSLSELAAALPPSNIGIHIPELSEKESAILVSRLLRRIAEVIGVTFNHKDTIGQANFPIVEPVRKFGLVTPDFHDQRRAS